jgi:hypothetical protein
MNKILKNQELLANELIYLHSSQLSQKNNWLNRQELSKEKRFMKKIIAAIVAFYQ